MDAISSCGLFACGNCEFRAEGSCPGCGQGNGLLAAWGRPPCSIFTCVHSRGIANCSACTNTACNLVGAVEGVCPLRSGLEDKSNWMWRIAQHLEDRAPCESHAPVPLKTLMRLRWYITALDSLERQGVDIVSSRTLAERIGVAPAMVRKDFSHFGGMGTPGVGYHVASLRERFHGVMAEHTCLVVWIGAQWLSNALTTVVESLDLNFRIVAALDTRPEWIGRKIGQWEVLPLDDLPGLLATAKIDGAVLALPEDAGRVAQDLIRTGVRGILNLTPANLDVPSSVSVRHVDLVGEMMALAVSVAPAH